MYLTKLTKSYLKYETNFKHPKKIRGFISSEFELVKRKRDKLRIGRTTFEYTDVRYAGHVLNSTFTLKFNGHLGLNAVQQKFKESYDFAT